MTIDEFTELYGVHGLVKKRGSVKSRPVLRDTKADKHDDDDSDDDDLPEEVDWHKAGKTTVPSDQGGCGSCWAFTTAATMESAFAIKHNSTPERLSVQYLLD